MASSSIDRTVLVLLGILLGSAPVLAEPLPAPLPYGEAEVSLYSSEEAWRLAHIPESHMLNATTCERVEGVARTDKQGHKQLVAHARSALFRSRHSARPFMRVEAREDGVFVARFPAEPNEVILSRAYIIDPRTEQYIYGKPTASVCRKGTVSVGGTGPVKED